MFITIKTYKKKLMYEGKAENTISRYVSNVNEFLTYFKDKQFNEETMMKFKEKLVKENEPSTVNAKLTTLNDYMKKCRIKLKFTLLNIKKNYFMNEDEVLSQKDVSDLLTYAIKTDERFYLMMKTYLATGIRVSEHRFITVSAVYKGRATITNKGSIRQVIIPTEIQKKLKQYIKKEKIKSGPVFITRRGNPVDRRNVWSKMQEIGEKAGIAKEKLHPHNLRHFFAQRMYKMHKDIVKLSAMLGHSRIETTRNYLKVLVSECKKQVEEMEREVEKEIKEIREREEGRKELRELNLE